MNLFTTFFKIGLLTLGGTKSTLLLMERELVEKQRWTSREELSQMALLAQACPGIFAINVSILVGKKRKGTWGAVFCALGTLLPSFLLILCLAVLYQLLQGNALFHSFFMGVRPAMIALLIVPVFRMARKAKFNLYTIWIPLFSALAIWMFQVNPIHIILFALAAGFIWGKIKEDEEGL